MQLAEEKLHMRLLKLQEPDCLSTAAGVWKHATCANLGMLDQQGQQCSQQLGG